MVRIRFLLRQCIFCLLTVGLVLGGLELGIRLMFDKKELLFSFEREDGLLASIGPARLIPRPGVWKKMDGDRLWTAHINGQSFREDFDTQTDHPPGKRFLALGDSWVFGIGVSQKETFIAQAEAKLTAEWGEPVDILNAGVPSFSAYDVLWRWDSLQDYPVDGLILGSPHNPRQSQLRAAEREAWYKAQQAGPPSRFFTYLLFRHYLVPFREPPYALPEAGEDADIEDILAIVRSARKKGLPVYFLAFPSRYRSLDVWKAWWDLLKPEGVVVGGHLLREQVCWSEDSSHPGPAGAAVIAGILVELMRQGQSLPLTDQPACL